MTPTDANGLAARAVVLAGGRGARLRPYTTVLPKPLMPIGDVPILDVILRQLAAAGARDVTISVGHLAELIRAYVGDGSRYDVPIAFQHEPSPLGTAGPLALVSGLDEAFLVMNGDVLTDLDFSALFAAHRARGAVATIAATPRTTEVEFGVLEVDDDGRLRSCVEKPRIETIVSTGIYVIEPEALRRIAPGERLDFPDLVGRLLHEGLAIHVHRHDGRWLDIGRESDYREAVETFERDPEAFLGRRGCTEEPP